MPGCYKLPWALRDRGLLHALGAADAGTIMPPRYQAAWTAGDGDRNADAIAQFSIALADRLGALFDAGAWPLVLGGDCSILIGTTLALKRRGRYGLVFLDAHSDFRHPHNAPAIGAAAGEDLAIITGRGDKRLINLQQRRPYVRDEDIVVVGVRANDEYLDELQTLDIGVITSETCASMQPDQLVAHALAQVTGTTDSFWIHLDADVVDMAQMPAVDSPEPEGLSFAARLLKERAT